MKLYRTSLYGEDGLHFSWHTSKAKALDALREHCHYKGEEPDETDVEAINVPTTRRQLIAFLNGHANSGNG